MAFLKIGVTVDFAVFSEIRDGAVFLSTENFKDRVCDLLLSSFRPL